MKRNSRWDDEPKLRNGEPVVVYPCESDLKLFQVLQRYRYLPLDFLVAYTGLSYDYLKIRCDLLARIRTSFLTGPRSRAQPNANCRYLTYELAFRGETQLKDNGRYSSEPRFGEPGSSPIPV